ncbi:MAG: cyclic pyranopterin monophosphate synthase MoaC [Deltaproteobacteria bacterium]|nr:MAG: cyclic pyranopterin monophosphate synthase MoaC [Deltaproteobacteria bacterium]
MDDRRPGPGGLTHLDADGRPRMVDVGAKADTDRLARAEGFVVLSEEAWRLVAEGRAHKGDVLAIARLAGIQAAKRTADLIPLCHPLPLDGVQVDAEALPADADGPWRVRVEARVHTRWRTGVEMEALTSVTAACLTVYDMVKAVDRGMRIEGIRLLEKRGGRSGHYVAPR